MTVGGTDPGFSPINILHVLHHWVTSIPAKIVEILTNKLLNSQDQCLESKKSIFSLHTTYSIFSRRTFQQQEKPPALQGGHPDLQNINIYILPFFSPLPGSSDPPEPLKQPHF
jgi:hypothetical protein